MLPEQERELIRKIRANDGGKEDERLKKHWNMWNQTYKQDQAYQQQEEQEPKSIQDLIRNIRQLLFRRQMEQGWFDFGRLDSLDDESTFTNITPPPKLNPIDEKRFKLFWNFDFPVHPNTHRLAETSSEQEQDPEDWVDGFAKHIEIEALLDE